MFQISQHRIVVVFIGLVIPSTTLGAEFVNKNLNDTEVVRHVPRWDVPNMRQDKCGVVVGQKKPCLKKPCTCCVVKTPFSKNGFNSTILM